MLRGLALVRVAIIRNGRLPRQRYDLAPPQPAKLPARAAKDQLPLHRLISGRLMQDLDVPVRSMHADPLPIPDQPGGMLHPHDGRQAVLPCDHRAMGH